MKEPSDDVYVDLKKIETSQSYRQNFFVGNIVRWKYEMLGHPTTLYMVVGFDNESPNIIVTRVLDRLGSLKEFHISQLELV